MNIRGIDTPKVSTLCLVEKTKGIEAQKEAERILLTADKVEIVNPTFGSFAGRVIADVLVDGESFADLMLRTGLALPYNGGRRPDWCSVLKDRQEK